MLRRPKGVHVTVMPSNDHDLLIAINAKVDMLVTGDGDKETRLRALERKVFVATGASGVLGGIAGFVVHFISATHK
jgi:hypothetical protein